MSALGTLQHFALALGVLIGASGLATSAAVPLATHGTRSWAPERRHRAMLLLALAPWLLAVTALLAVSLPSLASLIGAAQDHCSAHGGHPHLCFVHRVQGHGSALTWLAIGAGVAWLLARAALRLRALHMGTHAVQALLVSARSMHVGDAHLHVVPSERVLCASVGLWRPRIVFSEGLLRMLDAPALEVVIAHEREHARRRHALARLLARAASTCLLPGARASLLRTLELGAEQACDEAAASRVSDRLQVAETILQVERSLAVQGTPQLQLVGSAFGACAVAERVQAMLAPRLEAGSSAWIAAPLACALGALLGAYHQVHHTTESLLGIFHP